MSIEGVELRYVRRPDGEPEWIDRWVQRTKDVLQYRTQVRGVELENGFTMEWTDWQDVPVVEES